MAALRADRIASTGRLREARALLEPLLDRPPEDPDVRAYAHIVNARVLSELGELDDAIQSTETALALATDLHIHAYALKMRGIQHSRAKRFDLAVHDHARVVALARQLGPTELAPALLLESQSRMDVGQLGLAAELLDEGERVAATGRAPGSWPSHTLRGDLAFLRGRPLKAAEHCARSLEVADQEGRTLQVRIDLGTMADAMALTGRDRDALEIAGIAEALAADLGTQAGTGWHLQGRDYIPEAAERLGPNAAARAMARGREVPANRRVVRACALARAAVTVNMHTVNAASG